MIRLKLFVAALFVSSAAFAQFDAAPSGVVQMNKDRQVKAEFKRHISYLADDKLEGRATGSKGEKLAYQYIINEFQAAGIGPLKGEANYILPFNYYGGMQLNDASLSINGKRIELLHEFYPVGQSGNASFDGKLIDVGYGIEATDLGYNDYKKTRGLNGNAFLIDLSNPDSSNPHSEYAPYNGINYRIEKAIEKGAAAIVFLNSNQFLENPDANYNIKASRFDIPILFVNGLGKKKIKDEKLKSISMMVDMDEDFKTGNNVAGFIDHQAENTIVLGAHYDHLGYGGKGSRYTGGRAIHNGADDNASGVAMMLELAETLKSSEEYKGNNYLIIGFSGEEIGLYGSKDFVKKVDMDGINYMLNYDMVGRLNEEGVLNINGVGTSDKWSLIDDIEVSGIGSVTTTESGVGPSDHTAFYLEGIPVLHFFSGAHSDYHKPEDDEHLINYEGMESIYDYSLELIAGLNTSGKIDYIKTKDNNTDNAPKFTVTLGVMPDYVFTGKGMRIDSVIEDRPASNAGMEAGDVVIKMGEYNVNDMMGYMEALSKFKKGNSTSVVIQRADEELEFDVTF